MDKIVCCKVIVKINLMCSILILITIPVTIVHKYFHCVDLNSDIMTNHTGVHWNFRCAFFFFVVESNCEGHDHKSFTGLLLNSKVPSHII